MLYLKMRVEYLSIAGILEAQVLLSLLSMRFTLRSAAFAIFCLAFATPSISCSAGSLFAHSVGAAG